MNGAVDVREITRVRPISIGDTENGADERGVWPVAALTDDARVIVLEVNVN
jgi:hypothetical protein